MKTSIKIFGILMGLAIVFSTCSKIKDSQRACLVTSVVQGKRKVVFVYDNNRLLTLISDYSDSTLSGSSNKVNLYYDATGRLAYLAENLESGVIDSIAFAYGSSNIAESQYLKTGNGYSLNSRRSYNFDTQNNLSSDTLYSIDKGEKGQQIDRYTTYEYDQNYNVKTLENYNFNGTLNYSASYEYGDSIIQAASYAVTRFSVLGHFESSYQYILPNRKNLVYMERINEGINTNLNIFSYELDSKGNALKEYKVASNCGACSTTTTYKYSCN